MKYELFRDDDISVTSDIGLLMKVHDLFIRHNRIHRVAVQMENIWDNKEIWFWLMTAKNLEVALHGWDHKDYGKATLDQCSEDIRRSLDYWNMRVKRGGYSPSKITVFHPPWNSISESLSIACENSGLTLDSRVGPPVFNFHYWACIDPKRLTLLEGALSA